MSAHHNLRCASTTDRHRVKANAAGGYTTMGGGVTGYGLYGSHGTWIGRFLYEKEKKGRRNVPGLTRFV
jgi:hypothetical protein